MKMGTSSSSSSSSTTWLWFLPLLLILSFTTSSSSSSNTNPSSRKTYIIHMDSASKPSTFVSHAHWYQSLVASAAAMPDAATDTAADRILYSYETALHGFAAHLTDEEARRLEASYGVAGVQPEVVYRLHTTRSPGFLGLEAAGAGARIWSAARADRDVIVGVLDTGIWPESPSFSDRGMAAVPARWKGVCEIGSKFNRSSCNKKVVGARAFYRGYEAASGAINGKDELRSPRDQDGHGSHTAATAAGTAVPGANLLGYAAGTARGMSPNARVAAYKVCWAGGCFSSDILSAVDRAVADGVDVLSISLGGGAASYYRDSLSIAAFGAMAMGVFVSCSAGNGGPDPISLTNVSPWITTVGASTMDRDFPSAAKLGDGRVIAGVSLYKGRRNLSPNQQYPLVYLGGNSSSSGSDPRSLCLEGTLDPGAVAGKIVVCDRGINPRVQKGQVVKDAGGVGMILANTAVNGEELVADCHLLPAVGVGERSGRAIKMYARTSRRPTATLSFAGTKLGVKPSPVVAAFSSRGPNLLTLEVLKPDVVAPGVNILAAWTGAAGPSGLSTDLRRVGYNILSGTSMSCPHVSGVAALLMAAHPDWSPAAVKSALMTTAYVDDNTRRPLQDAATGGPSSPFDHGAGHIDPSKALDPGLLYDIDSKDYLDFLCTQKLTPLQLKSFTKASTHVCNNTLFTTAGDLNYPALSVVFPDQRPASAVTLRRTATNVGPPASSYRVSVSQFKGAAVAVEPPALRFTAKNQKLRYRVTFTAKSPQPSPEFGALVWSDGVHTVRSPIVLTWLPPM